MTKWALDQCEWCDGYDTDWVKTEEHHEPNLGDMPEFDPIRKIITVKLLRHCNKCDTFKTVKMCFALKDGWAIEMNGRVNE